MNASTRTIFYREMNFRFNSLVRKYALERQFIYFENSSYDDLQDFVKELFQFLNKYFYDISLTSDTNGVGTLLANSDFGLWEVRFSSVKYIDTEKLFAEINSFFESNSIDIFLANSVIPSDGYELVLVPRSKIDHLIVDRFPPFVNYLPIKRPPFKKEDLRPFSKIEITLQESYSTRQLQQYLYQTIKKLDYSIYDFIETREDDVFVIRDGGYLLLFINDMELGFFKVPEENIIEFPVEPFSLLFAYAICSNTTCEVTLLSLDNSHSVIPSQEFCEKIMA